MWKVMRKYELPDKIIRNKGIIEYYCKAEQKSALTKVFESNTGIR